MSLLLHISFHFSWWFLGNCWYLIVFDKILQHYYLYNTGICIRDKLYTHELEMFKFYFNSRYFSTCRLTKHKAIYYRIQYIPNVFFVKVTSLLKKWKWICVKYYCWLFLPLNVSYENIIMFWNKLIWSLQFLLSTYLLSTCVYQQNL